MNYPQIKPTLNLDFSNTKTLDPRINFRRGTPGAYYDGKTHAKAEENLLSYSEKFDQAGTTFGLWDSRNLNLTNNSEDEFLAPDGTQTAWKISDSGTSNSNHSLFQVVYTTDSSQERITTSIFAKAGDVNRYLQLLHGADDTNYGFPFANFDLFTGTITRSEETLNASMTDVGNGWYRCSITFFTTTVSGKSINPVFYMVDNPLADRDEYYTGDGSSGFYIWGAQLEQRDGVTAYTPTNGNPITKYQPQLMFASPDQPRFDHDPLTGESKGLLIEESRTNLIEYSEDFSSWQYNSNVVSKDNHVVAPDGTIGAAEIVETTSNTQHNVAQSISTTGQKVFSVFVKKGVGSRNFRITDYNVTDGEVSVTYNLSTGDKVSEVGSPNSTITYYSNGWYRISITSTTTTSSTYYIQLMDNNTTTYTGDGYSSMYIWGAQLEAGSFPTSYIKTSGASATRSADNASITGENFSSWYRQDEGTFQIDFNHQYDDSSWDYILSINPSTEVGDYDQNNLSLRRNLSNEKYAIRAFSSGSNLSTSLELDGVFYENNFKKLCLSYDRNNVYLSNKNQLISDSTIDSLRHLKALYLFNIDGDDTRTAKSTGYIKKLAYYPQRLTNEQLQQLTK